MTSSCKKAINRVSIIIKYIYTNLLTGSKKEKIMVIKENDAKATVLNNLVTRTLMVHNDKLMMVRFDFK